MCSQLVSGISGDRGTGDSLLPIPLPEAFFSPFMILKCTKNENKNLCIALVFRLTDSCEALSILKQQKIH